MRLFAERGYADVTVRRIAAMAGVSASLVIHHYGSKENLRAVLDERVASRSADPRSPQSELADEAPVDVCAEVRRDAGPGAWAIVDADSRRLLRPGGA